MTVYICSYSVKAEIIASVYNRRTLTHITLQSKAYYIYYVMAIFQFILLVLWTMFNNGIVKEQKYLKNVGQYEEEICSIGNHYLINTIFVIDFVLLIISITNTYRGRNSKYFFLIIIKMFL